MKVKYNVSDKIQIEFEAQSEAKVFEMLASLEDTFSAKPCKIEGSMGDEHFVVRSVEGNSYFEQECSVKVGKFVRRAKLVYGQNKEGGSLFPKWTMDKSTGPAPYWKPWVKGKGKPENAVYDFQYSGWHIYDKEKTKDAE